MKGKDPCFKKGKEEGRILRMIINVIEIKSQLKYQIKERWSLNKNSYPSLEEKAKPMESHGCYVYVICEWG